jgi:hypothetical protein
MSGSVDLSSSSSFVDVYLASVHTLSYCSPILANDVDSPVSCSRNVFRLSNPRRAFYVNRILFICLPFSQANA